MEREIKFRGKSKKTRKWLYGYLGESKFRILDYVYTDKVIFDNVLSFNTDNSAYVIKDLSVEEETICQFTGLKDKNGTDIYEGDILMCIGQREDNKGRKYFRKVLFIDGTFGMRVPEYKCVSSLFNHVVDGKLNWEVVGNIYDNPELLED